MTPAISALAMTSDNQSSFEQLTDDAVGQILWNHPEVISKMLGVCRRFQKIARQTARSARPIETEIDSKRAWQGGIAQMFAMTRHLMPRPIASISDEQIEQLVELYPNVVRLDLSRCISISDRALSAIARLKQLQRLDLSGGSRLTPQGLRSLRQLCELSDLVLAHCSFSMASAPLPELTSLTQLNLTRCQSVDDRALEKIAAMPRLAILNLTGCRGITSRGLTMLGALSALRDLNLTALVQLEGGALRPLLARRRLRVLNARNCSRLSDQSLCDCERSAALTALDIGQTLIGERGIGSIGKLHCLKSLGLSSCQNLTQNALLSLGRLTQLTHLDLSNLPRAATPGLSFLRALLGLRALSLTGCESLVDTHLSALAPLTNLQTLRLVGCDIGDEGLVHLGNLRRLSLLDLSGTRHLSDRCLGRVAQLSELAHLNLSGSRRTFSALGFAALGKLTNLTCLELQGRLTDPISLRSLRSLRRLRHLALRGCADSDQWRLISQLPQLSSLSLASHEVGQSPSAAALSNCRELASLRVAGYGPFSNAQLRALAGLTNLRICAFDACEITDADLAQVAKIAQLEALSLVDCEQITDLGLKSLTNLAELGQLSLSRNRAISSRGLRWVAELSNLHFLCLVDSPLLDDAGVQTLISLQKLTCLYIFHADITDCALQSIGQLRALFELELHYCGHLTDEGLEELRGLLHLRTLRITGCYDITAVGLRALGELLPSVEIVD